MREQGGGWEIEVWDIGFKLQSPIFKPLKMVLPSASAFLNFTIGVIIPKLGTFCIFTTRSIADHFETNITGLLGKASTGGAVAAILVPGSWKSPADVRSEYPAVSVLQAGRVVFNIKGNRYRLIVRINYDFGIVWVRFVGTHA